MLLIDREPFFCARCERDGLGTLYYLLLVVVLALSQARNTITPRAFIRVLSYDTPKNVYIHETVPVDEACTLEPE